LIGGLTVAALGQLWIRLARAGRIIVELAIHLTCVGGFLVWLLNEHWSPPPTQDVLYLRADVESGRNRVQANKASPSTEAGIEATTSPVIILPCAPPGKEPSPYAVTLWYLFHALESAGYRPHVMCSTGSLDSLALLDSAEITNVFALAQADVLAHYVNGNHPQFVIGRKTSHVRSVAPVFEEWLDIRSHSPRSPSPNEELLSDATQVCADAVGSGSMVTALNLQRILGGPWSPSTECPPKQSEAGVYDLRVRSPEGQPSHCAPSIVLHPEQCMVGLSVSTARLMSTIFPALYTIVEYNQRDGRKDDWIRGRATIATNAVLVARRDTDGDLVRTVLDALNQIRGTECPIRPGQNPRESMHGVGPDLTLAECTAPSAATTHSFPKTCSSTVAHAVVANTDFCEFSHGRTRSEPECRACLCPRTHT
jgi:hypothetical protein